MPPGRRMIVWRWHSRMRSSLILAFKPSPKVYQLGIERAGCAKDDILWVTGHFWEAVGAVRQGLRVAWTNRQRMPKLQIGVEPTYTTKNLQELADILASE